jgi:hypothetical protein
MRNFLWSLWYLPLNLWYKYKSWRYERKCIKHLGMKPQKMYVSKEAYDELVRRINNPDPEQIESLKRILQRKSPWDEE